MKPILSSADFESLIWSINNTAAVPSVYDEIENKNNDIGNNAENNISNDSLRTIPENLPIHNSTLQLDSNQVLSEEEKEESHGADKKIDLGANNSEQYCFDWNSTNSDDWWTGHPTFEATTINEKELCFTQMKDSKKSAFFQQLHDIQYNASNCNNVVTKYMWSSGFSADFGNVADGLAYAIQAQRPFQITLKPGLKWHYASFKLQYRKDRDSVCASSDMYCYFLPLGICQPGAYDDKGGAIADRHYYLNNLSWLREYATRPQQWLRHSVMTYISTAMAGMPNTDQQCAALHVRRADVVLHGNKSRKYFPIATYLERLLEKFPNVKDILLFTDDGNAIDEIHEFHPEYNWMYLKKKRHRGSEGGWENQIQSDSPAQEVIALLAVFEIAQKCDVLVHTNSGFSNMIYDSMIKTGRDISRIRVDVGHGRTFHTNNTASEEKLRLQLESKRNNPNVGQKSEKEVAMKNRKF